VKYKNIIISFIISFIIFTIIYSNNSGYHLILKASERLPIVGTLALNFINNIENEVDVYKKIKNKQLPDNSYVNLILSPDDLKNLKKRLYKFLEEGFIRDEINSWRKAKVIIDGQKQKIQYKVHGTSVTPILKGVEKDFGDIELNQGYFSLKIKHKKDSKYNNLMRRYNLITIHDELNISTIAFNKIADYLGLISPHGKMVILKINNSPAGMYMMVENHSKEWFERVQGMTNYTLLKSNDDWDHKFGVHVSDTDLFIQDKEVSGNSNNKDVALGALQALFNAIKNNNVSRVKDLVDIEYMSKYLALLAITNNAHPITGDNLRYIYDHTSGKFKFLFRLEDHIIRNMGNIAQFNSNIFHSSAYSNADTHRLFKLLLTDKGFRNKRDLELFNIIKKKDALIKIIDNTLVDNFDVLMASTVPRRPELYYVEKAKEILEWNLNKAKSYIGYNKIYITKYPILEGGADLSILNDSYNKILLSQILYIDSDKNHVNSMPANIQVPSHDLNENFDMLYRPYRVTIKPSDFKRLVFKNSITGEDINSRHIYINSAKINKLAEYDDTINALKKNSIDYSVEYDTKTFTIKKGDYHLISNLIMPNEYSVIIQPGVSISLDKNISFIIMGSLYAVGTKSKIIQIKSYNKNENFGVFGVVGRGNGASSVNMKYVEISGGSEAIVNGISFTGQLSIHNSRVIIENSKFEGSSSDDGVNIKFSDVHIENSRFVNNKSDQLDLDYCNGIILNSSFLYTKEQTHSLINADGLDISGTFIKVVNSIFSGFGDKGVSIGEISTAFLKNNVIKNNISGISVKDGSIAFVAENKFNSNKVDVSLYVKKSFYKKPEVVTMENNSINFQNINGKISYIDKEKIFNFFEMKRTATQ
jgi:hypothetical protein